MYVPVLALRLAPSAEPVRPMTMSFLPDDGLLVGTPKTQLETCNGTNTVYKQLYHNTRRSATIQRKPLKRVKPFYPRAKAPGLYGLFL